MCLRIFSRPARVHPQVRPLRFTPFLVVVLFNAALHPQTRLRARNAFAQKVQPIFQEHCYKCHSHAAEKIKGGLVVDSRDGMLTGGDTGPAIVPGEPEKSLLIEAVRYGNRDLQMPPKNKKLTATTDRARSTEWVKKGAPLAGGRRAERREARAGAKSPTRTGNGGRSSR